MPSLRAFEVMPRCRISRRNTWQRLQSVRKLRISFPASLPLRMWSMWQRFRATRTLQWTHLPPSRSQTLRRVSRQTSRGCRDLGIILTLPYLTEPCRAEPSPATPCRGVPCQARLYQMNDTRSCGSTSYRSLPYPAIPCPTVPCHAEPHQAMPCHAPPGRGVSNE